MFIAYVRGRSHATRKLGPLTDNGGNLVESSEGMSELFNEAFGKVFTKETDYQSFPKPNGYFQVTI